MQAMVLKRPGQRLRLETLPMPAPGPADVRIRIEACGVCRTDLHLLDGELPQAVYPIVPGHEIVGIVETIGRDVDGVKIGQRVGVPWLGGTCGACPYCQRGMENLCDRPVFTGCTRDGGYATHVLADYRFIIPLGNSTDAVNLAPLLCAGLIGWRSLAKAGEGPNLGIFGFGAAAHIVAQIALRQGRHVFAFTRPGDRKTQDFARRLGAVWAGGSDEKPDIELDSAIIFAPVGALVPTALRMVRRGGTVVCGGIHMSDIPSFQYDLLWHERRLLSVANLTRKDGRTFFQAGAHPGVETHTVVYPLAAANEALADLRAGRLTGAAVLVPPMP